MVTQANDVENFLSGAANVGRNIINFPIEGINYLAHKVGDPNQLLPYLHQYSGLWQTNPNSLSYDAGSIGGALGSAILAPWFAPDGFLAGAEETAPEVVTYLKNKIPGIVKSIAAGAGLGALTGNPGQRTSSALWGGLGSGVFDAGLSGIRYLKNLFESAELPTNYVKSGSNILSKKVGSAVDNSGGDTAEWLGGQNGIPPDQVLANKIAQLLKGFHQTNNENYAKVWNALSEGTSKLPGMSAADFPNYTNFLKNYEDKLFPIDIPTKLTKIGQKLGDAPDLPDGDNPDGTYEVKKGGINPQDVHFTASVLKTIGRSARENNQIHGQAAAALGKDLETFITKVNPTAANLYKEAQDFYRTQYIPYLNVPGVQNVWKAFGKTNLKSMSKEEMASILANHPGFTGTDYTNLLSNIYPKTTDMGNTKINRLVNLTNALGRSPLYPFNPNALANNVDPDLLNLSRKLALTQGKTPAAADLLNNYSYLSGAQKAFYFTPEEQAVLDRAVEESKNPSSKSWPQAVGHAAFHHALNFATQGAGTLTHLLMKLGSAALPYPSLRNSLAELAGNAYRIAKPVLPKTRRPFSNAAAAVSSTFNSPLNTQTIPVPVFNSLAVRN